MQTFDLSKKNTFESPHLINNSGDFFCNYLETATIKLPETYTVIGTIISEGIYIGQNQEVISQNEEGFFEFLSDKL